MKPSKNLIEPNNSGISIETVKNYWSVALENHQLSPESHFFELGGDSFAAVAMLDEISEIAGFTIGIDLLFRNPELGSFSRAISKCVQQSSATEKLFFKAVESSGSIPVFCFAHAPFLRNQTVFYHPGIYERIHNSSETLTTSELDHLLNQLIKEILEAHPQGPFRLSGYCHGGWLALAIAQRLIAAGHEVDFLGLIEAFPRLSWNSGFRNKLKRPDRLLGETFKFLVRNLHKLGLLGLVDNIKAQTDWWVRAKEKLNRFGSVQCYRNFEAQVFSSQLDSKIDFFMQSNYAESSSMAIPLFMWKQKAKAGFTIHLIEASNHQSIRSEANRNGLAVQMSRLLNLLSDSSSQSTGNVYQQLLASDLNTSQLKFDRVNFFNALLNNSQLEFYDRQSSVMASIKDVIYSYEDAKTEQKKLAIIYQDNSFNSVAAILGMLWAGYAIVLLNSKLSADLQSRIESHYRPHVIYDPKRTYISGYSKWNLPGDKFLFKSENEWDHSPVHEKVDVLITTSGSTGSPKFVKLSLGNLLANAYSIANYLPISDQDVVPLNLPLDYSYGLSILISNSLICRKLVCSVPNATDPRFWKEFTQMGMTTFAGTPELYQLLQDLDFFDWQLSSLRYFTQAGGHLNEESVRRFASWGTKHSKQFFVMYGQTEASPRISYLPPELAESHPGSIGIPIPMGSLTIDEETSELLYKGPNVFGGYATRLEDLALYQQPTVLRTGDLARKDENDLYYIFGRTRRMAKVMGSRVNLDDIESLLSKWFPKSTFACVRLKEEQIGIFHEGSAYDREAISHALVSNIKIPTKNFEIRNLTSIPKTERGKIDYRYLSSLGLSKVTIDKL